MPRSAPRAGEIYVSLDPETPFRELHRAYARLADTLNAADIPARRLLLTIEVTLERVVDPAGPGHVRRLRPP